LNHGFDGIGDRVKRELGWPWRGTEQTQLAGLARITLAILHHFPRADKAMIIEMSRTLWRVFS